MSNELTTEIIHKELDLIQSCINRMGQNSFLIKGWYVSLLAVSAALKINNIYLYSGLLIILSLCFYYFNFQFYVYEKQFRALYSKRLTQRLELKCSKDLYKLEIAGTQSKNIFKYIFSYKSLLFFYFTIAIIFIGLNYLIDLESDSEKITIEIQGLK